MFFFESSAFVDILIVYLIGLVRGLQHGLSKGVVQPERSISNHPACTMHC